MDDNRILGMKNNHYYLEEDADVRNTKYDYIKQKLKPNEIAKNLAEPTNTNRYFNQNVKTNQRQFPVTDAPKLTHLISQSDPVGFGHNHLVEKKSFTPTRRKPIKPVFFHGESSPSHAKEIKKPKISCSVPVINCVIGDKQHIHDRNCDGRHRNFEEDFNQSFTEKTFRVYDRYEIEKSPRRFNKDNYLSKDKSNKIEHQYVELEPNFHNIVEEGDYRSGKIYIKPSSSIGTSSSECDFNHAEEYTFSRDSHNVFAEQRRRRNMPRLQLHSKYNNSLGSRFYKSRYRRYNPVDYTSSTHPVSCSSDGSLKGKNGFVRRRRRRIRYRKTKPNKEIQPKNHNKKPLVSPQILKNLKVCEIPENRHLGDGEKGRKSAALPKSKNKLRDVNNNNIIPNTEVHKALKPKVTEEELWKRFQKLFRSYSSTKLHSGDLISPKISICWMKNVGVIKDVLNNKDAETAFKKAAGQKITMNVHEYKEFLLSLTMRRKLPLYEIYRRMCGI